MTFLGVHRRNNFERPANGHIRFGEKRSRSPNTSNGYQNGGDFKRARTTDNSFRNSNSTSVNGHSQQY